MGLTKWRSKPASRERRRVSGSPSPVTAASSFRPAERSRSRRHPAGQLVAVDPRQADIRQDGLGTERPGDPQRRLAVRRRLDVVSLEPEDQFQAVG